MRKRERERERKAANSRAKCKFNLTATAQTCKLHRMCALLGSAGGGGGTLSKLAVKSTLQYEGKPAPKTLQKRGEGERKARGQLVSYQCSQFGGTHINVIAYFYFFFSLLPRLAKIKKKMRNIKKEEKGWKILVHGFSQQHWVEKGREGSYEQFEVQLSR